MRLGRLVLAGLVAGAVTGFLVALLRPRGTHPVSLAVPALPPDDRPAPVTEPSPVRESVQQPGPTPASVTAPRSPQDERSRITQPRSDHGVAGRQTGAGAHD